MRSINVNLWDDNAKFVVANVTVICNEHQALRLHKMKETILFKARKLPTGVSRSMTFLQFKRHFLR